MIMKKILLLLMASGIGFSAFAQMPESGAPGQTVDSVYIIHHDTHDHIIIDQADDNSLPPANLISTPVGVRINPESQSYIRQYAPDGCILARDGNLTLVKDNSSSEVKTSVVLSNGAMINPAGKITFKDGSSGMLKSGHCMKMDGSVFVVDPGSAGFNTEVGED